MQALRRKRGHYEVSEYKGYDPKVGKKATMKYIKEKRHRLELTWKKEDFDNRIAPAAEKVNMTVSAFIKEAIDEKIERMNNIQ